MAQPAKPMPPSPFVHLQIRNPKDDETPIEAATHIFASLFPSHVPLWRRWFFGDPKSYSFEIYLLGQTVFFYVTAPTHNETLVSSLVTSSFPKSVVQKTTDPMDIVFKSKRIEVGEMVLTNSYYFPLKSYKDFEDIDSLSPVLGYLARQNEHLRIGIQFLVQPAYFPWQDQAVSKALSMIKDPEAEKFNPNPQKMLINQKASFQGGKACIRLIVGSTKPDLNPLPFLQNLAGTFGSFSLGEGNRLGFKRSSLFKDTMMRKIRTRTMGYFENQHQILNAQELATMWHPTGFLLAGVKNMAWGKTLAGEPPEALPIIKDDMTEDQKKDINFFAKTEYKNRETIFGIKTPDRRRHVYIIGKTGTGKSTLIGNMAIDDIRKGRGIGIIDPHGDLCEAVLDFIPKRRLNDVVYLEPFDLERPFSLNVLEVRNQQQKDLVASGIVSIFAKLYKDSWGPRLEYILRNVILTLLETPGATLVDVLSLLSNDRYRKKVVDQLQDQVLRNFWLGEFAKMPDKLKAEAVSPIQNKVGQFVSSKMIRNIIGKDKSSINLEEIMNDGKILLLNLSQGKLGEDNAALLGAMIITQIQLAAMNRSFVAEEDRKDFFLYVDEFQNFATSSFIKILSEARKYRLALTLANQYIEQLDEEITKAIFGNVGTLISFVVGARDAEMLSLEYSEMYTQNDLVGLGKHEVIMKLSIDNMMSMPFPAKTLPPPALKNDNREKIIRVSKEKYGRKVTETPPMPIMQSRNEPEESHATPLDVELTPDIPLTSPITDEKMPATPLTVGPKKSEPESQPILEKLQNTIKMPTPNQQPKQPARPPFNKQRQPKLPQQRNENRNAPMGQKNKGQSSGPTQNKKPQHSNQKNQNQNRPRPPHQEQRMPNPEPTHTPLPPMQPAAHNPSPPPANPTAPVHSIKINLPKFDKQ